MTIRNLDAMMAPKSVVLIGASDRAGSVGGTVAHNLASGFRGHLYFVNPHHLEIHGVACHPCVAALPEVPDLAVIATPPPTIPGLIGELAEKGCRAVVVITAGLDAAEKQAMLDAGKSRLVRVLGPNSVGLLLPPLGLNASFAHRAALPGDLAFLSQSGALVTAVIDWASDRGIGFSQIVSLGDMADADFGDMLDFLAGDTKSRAILLYMEALTQAPKFMSAARRAARSKPVIVIKSGRHATAAKAAASHTGRLAGSDAAYEAAFRRAGLLRVTALEQLFEAAEMLSRVPRLHGDRLMIVTNGGGAGVLATDHLADDEGTLAVLAGETRAALDRILPPGWSKGNPVDVIGDASPERYAAALEIVLEDPNCDAVLAIQCPTALASSTEIARRTIETYRKSGSTKPLVTNWLGAGAAAEARRLFAAEKIPTFETPDAAVDGFSQLVRYARAQDALMRTPPPMPVDHVPDKSAVDAMISAAMKAGRFMLSEAEGKELLAAYGIPVAETLIATSPKEAASTAERLLAKYGSVVLKILSDDISHKSDVGGVHLDLTSPGAVEIAAQEMLARVKVAVPNAQITGFTLSPMILRPRSHELIAGMTVDATFGPLMLFGAGGTSVEVVADTSLALPPLDLKLASDLISQTRISRLLAGYRDRKPADVAAIADALVRLSALACNHPAIREIDINPLLADETGVIALDARVKLADAAQEPRVPLAVKPYPDHLARTIQHEELGPILLRPIKPEDELLYASFLSRVTQHDLRLRFFAPSKGLSHKFLARLTQIDYAREMAFVAIDQKGELLGVSRFAADPDYEKAEYAVLVRSDLKGQGLGWKLMCQLIKFAKASGLKEITGDVLAENVTMLRMCRNLGFAIETAEEDPSMRQVVLDLDQMKAPLTSPITAPPRP